LVDSNGSFRAICVAAQGRKHRFVDWLELLSAASMTKPRPKSGPSRHPGIIGRRTRKRTLGTFVLHLIGTLAYAAPIAAVRFAVFP
jgi:hypothetical protein